MERLRSTLPADRRAAVTRLELDLAHSFEPVAGPPVSPRWTDDWRGLLGVELTRRGKVFRLAPTR